MWVGCRQVDQLMLACGHRRVNDHVPRRNETCPSCIIGKARAALHAVGLPGAMRLPLIDSYFTEVIACL